MTRKAWLHAAAVCAVLSAGLLIIRAHWSLGPIINSDEVRMAHTVQSILGCACGAPPQHSYYGRLWGKNILLLLGVYHGPWDGYSLVPFLWLIADKFVALFMNLYAWALAYLVSVYAAGAALLRGALLPMLCALAVATSRIFFLALENGLTRAGFSGLALYGFSLYFLITGWDCRSAKRFWLSCGLLGFSLGSSQAAFAYLPCWAASLACLRWQTPGWTPTFRQAAVALCLFAVGIFPFFIANGATRNGLFRTVTEGALVTHAGVDNRRYADNMSERWDQLGRLAETDASGDRPGRPALLWLAAGAFLAGMAGFARLRRKDRRSAAGGWIPAVHLVIIFALMGLTLGGLWEVHFLVLWPFLFFAVGAVPLFWKGERQPLLKAALSGMLMLVAFANVEAGFDYRSAARTGSFPRAILPPYYDDETLRALGWLAERPGKAVHGNLAHLLCYLNDDPTPPPAPDVAAAPGSYWVTRGPRAKAQKLLREVQDRHQRPGGRRMRLALRKVFLNRNLRRECRVYEVLPNDGRRPRP